MEESSYLSIALGRDPTILNFGRRLPKNSSAQFHSFAPLTKNI